MFGDSMVQAVTSGEVAATAVTRVLEGSGGGGGDLSVSGEDGKSIRIDDVDEGGVGPGYGSNRWPRQETLALLKIRSDMDAVFRDSSLKTPLWEEVSRKMAEMGFNRSAKKCREKFENVFKYHKRTKESRTAKSEGKTYRFFDQLEVFRHQHPSHPTSATSPPPVRSQNPVPWTGPLSVPEVTFPLPTNSIDIISQHNVVVSTLNPIPSSPALSSQTMNPSQHAYPSSYQNNTTTHLFSSSTSSSTASDEDLERRRKRKRKRNWKDFFERLARDVMKKQETLQKKFLETVEKGEHERMVREEVWRMQEMERIKREHEILIQERSTAVAKDAAVVAFLQNISGLHNSVQTRENPQPIVQVAPPPPPQPPPPPAVAHISSLDIQRKDNGENMTGSSSSRWPKSEVEALIRLRTTLDNKYQENAAKGPLWEEISAGMRKLGYNRSAKRCKEKWENINKYYKKVKESNKKRPEDSKTCTYFHQLDALYKEKKTDHQGSQSSAGYPDMPIGTMEP